MASNGSHLAPDAIHPTRHDAAIFIQCQAILENDGPVIALLKTIRSYDGEPPPDWNANGQGSVSPRDLQSTGEEPGETPVEEDKGASVEEDKGASFEEEEHD